MPNSKQLYDYFVYWLPYHLKNSCKSKEQRIREIRDGVDDIAWSTYAATVLNAFKNAIPAPILLTQLKAMRDLPLCVSGPILFGATAGVTALNYWMEWNKLALRMQLRHDFARLKQETTLETGTVYFVDCPANPAEKYGVAPTTRNPLLDFDDEENEEIVYRTLYYVFLTEDGNIDLVSLERLDNDLQGKIRRNDFMFTPRETQKLERLMSPEHKASLKADSKFIPGDFTDSTLFWKMAISLTCSIFAGAVLGMSVAEDKSFGEMVFAAVMLGTLNFIKGMVTESVVALAAHNYAIQQRHHQSLKSLKEQPFFSLIFNDVFMWFLRDISPALMSVMSLASIAQLLSKASPALAAIVCIPLYFTATSGFRIFTLGATKKLLEQGQIEFSMENSWSDSPYLLLWLFGELGSGRWLTVDHLLSKGWSPEAITNMLVVANTLSFVALLYAPLNNYLMCPTQNCFGEGYGSILTFFTDADNLDHFAKNNPAVFPIVFTILLTALFLATALSNLSQLAMIKEYIQHRLASMEQSGNAAAKEPLLPSVNADDQREVRLIKPDGHLENKGSWTNCKAEFFSNPRSSTDQSQLSTTLEV